MPDTAPERTDDKLERLYELVQDIRIAMMTTRRRDGSLVSRPMATQRRADGAHFWFVTPQGRPRLQEVMADAHVNLAYTRANGREWVSVSGVARVSRDRSRIRELYEPTWKVWFPDEGGDRNGGPDDPRIVLLAIEARSAHFLTADKPAPVALFEHVKSVLTGRMPDVGQVQTVSAGELDA